MSLLRSPVFKSIGAVCFGIAVLGFCAHVTLKVLRGEGLSTYVNAKGVVTPYVAGFVLIMVVGIVFLVVGINHLWLMSEPARMRRALERARQAREAERRS